ncbi:hypothetical protein T45_00521 [Streptomyces turgidiscabies]|nr:hypothetical protein T45_00521 [Streptomyces turgidiscabies]
MLYNDILHRRNETHGSVFAGNELPSHFEGFFYWIHGMLNSFGIMAVTM